MELPWRAAKKRRSKRELRHDAANNSPLSADATSVEHLRGVAETQLGLQASYASSLDTQALALLAVDVALIGILAGVLVSPAALPHGWGFTLIPLGVSGLFAVLAATVRGAPETGADLVELLIHQDEHGTIPAVDLNMLLTRRAIQAREVNLIQLTRKQRMTSLAVLALVGACILLGALATVGQGVQSRHHGSKPKHSHRHHGGRKRATTGGT